MSGFLGDMNKHTIKNDNFKNGQKRCPKCGGSGKNCPIFDDSNFPIRDDSIFPHRDNYDKPKIFECNRCKGTGWVPTIDMYKCSS